MSSLRNFWRSQAGGSYRYFFPNGKMVSTPTAPMQEMSCRSRISRPFVGTCGFDAPYSGLKPLGYFRVIPSGSPSPR